MRHQSDRCIVLTAVFIVFATAQVFRAFSTIHSGDEGVSVSQVVNQLSRYSEQQVRRSIEWLTDEGHLYSTVDDDHYKSRYRLVMFHIDRSLSSHLANNMRALLWLSRYWCCVVALDQCRLIIARQLNCSTALLPCSHHKLVVHVDGQQLYSDGCCAQRCQFDKPLRRSSLLSTLLLVVPHQIDKQTMPSIVDSQLWVKCGCQNIALTYSDDVGFRCSVSILLARCTRLF